MKTRIIMRILLLILAVFVSVSSNAQKEIIFLNLKSSAVGDSKGCNLAGGSLYVRANQLWKFVSKTDEYNFSLSSELDNIIQHDSAAKVEIIISTNYADYEAAIPREIYNKSNRLLFNVIKVARDYMVMVAFNPAEMGATYPLKVRENRKQADRFL